MTIQADQVSAPVGQLQTDTFCESCGYNLHSQIITRDERLNILICRCPECGRFAAAGQGTTIGRVWLNRLGTLILVVWAMFLFCAYFVTTLFMGIMPYSHLRRFTRWAQISEYDPHAHAMVNRMCYILEYPTVNNPEEAHNQLVSLLFFGGVAGMLAFLTGMFHSVFFWHVKGKWKLLALLFPLIACGGALLCWYVDYMSRYLRVWGATRVAAYLLLECGCAVAGIAFGRSVARAVIRWFLPPKPRQHLAFLWTADGKKLPV